MFVNQAKEKLITIKIVSDYEILKNVGAVIVYRNKNRLEKILMKRLLLMGIDDAIVRYIDEENVFIVNRGGV